MTICALTGSTGVIGKRLRKSLPFKFYNFKKNITNPSHVEKWVNAKDFDIIIHLAAIVPTKKVNKNYLKAKRVNVNGTINLIKSLLKKKNKPKWFFFASTSHVYNMGFKYKKITEINRLKPVNKYGKTKELAENIIRKKLKNSGIKVCIARIFSVTDSTQKAPYLIPNLLKRIKKCKNKILLNDLNHYRDFVTTKNIASAIHILYKKKSTGKYNIGSGKKFFLKDIARLIAKKYKKKVEFKDKNKTTFLIANNKKLKKLGWKPKKFTKTLSYFY